MWSHLIKLVSLSKGALVVGVAASAAMVSNAEFSNTASHNELPSATPAAIVSEAPKAKAPTLESKPSEKPNATTEAPKSEQPKTSTEEPKSAEQPKTNETGTPELAGLVKECVTKYTALRAAGDVASAGERESTTAVCIAAIKQSGLTSSEFAFKYGLNTQPAHAVTDITALVKDCFAKYTAKDPGAGDACKKAIDASGLSTNDFFAKYGTPARPSTETKPTATPKATLTTETYALVRKCLELYAGVSTTTDTKAVSDACKAAIAATGLTATDFWATYGKQLTSTSKPTTTPAPTATPKPVTNPAEVSLLIAKCLDLYKNLTSTGDTKTVSDACKVAIQASGMSSADFWAKYHPTTN